MSPVVQKMIIAEYRRKSQGSDVYSFTVDEIAERHGVSVSSVHNLVKLAKIKRRPRGGRKHEVPNARIMKILRDSREPGRTYEEVGRMNPHPKKDKSGRSQMVATTRQRVAQIVKRWKHVFRKSELKGTGYSPGDIIEWAGVRHVVVDYTNSHFGSVIDLTDHGEIEKFCWNFKGETALLVKAAEKKMTPAQVRQKYLVRNDNGHAPAESGADT
jgi:hypothetical protein